MPWLGSMRRIFLLLIGMLWCLGTAWGQLELTEGMTRAEFEALAGKPTNVLSRGSKTILTYPNKGRVELVDGRVKYFEGVEAKPELLAELQAQALGAEAGQPPAGTDVAAPASQSSSAQGEATGSAGASEAPADAQSPGALVETLEKQADMASPAAVAQATFPGMAEEDEDSSPDHNPWWGLLIEALFKIPVTVCVLKFAFKWSDIDSDWGQMWLPAIVDTFVRSGLVGLGLVLWNVDHLFYGEEVGAFCALMFTLIKTTHASNFVRALSVAFAAKIASYIVWLLLGTIILNVLFG